MARVRTAAWAALPVNVRAAVWIFLGATGFAVTDALAKAVGQTVPLPQMMFFRYLLGLVFILPTAIRLGPGKLATRRPVFHLLRTLTSVGAQLFMWYAVIHMYIADATAIAFARPLFTTLLAALWLGEVVRGARWTATAIGFAGVLIMVRPGAEGVDIAALSAVAGTLLFGIAIVQTRLLGRTNSPFVIVVYYQAVSCALFAVPALLVWQPPTPREWLLLAAMSITATLAQIMAVRGFAMGETSVVGPVEYIRLVVAAFLGYLVFAELPDMWTFLGAAIIVGSTLFVTLHRSRTTAPSAEAGPARPDRQAP